MQNKCFLTNIVIVLQMLLDKEKHKLNLKVKTTFSEKLKISQPVNS